MFCPNCGRDCGDGRFCSHCGTQVQQAQAAAQSQNAAWLAGMPCPRCGGMQIENGHCAFCGVQLTATQPQENAAEEVSAEIPCGVYSGITSSLTLHENDCVVRTTPFIFKKYETKIPYDQITAVVYVRPVGRLGHILFRWEGNKNIPIPENNIFSADHTTVTFAERLDLLYYHIFHMLKNVVPASAECSMRIPAANVPGVDELLRQVDIGPYFEKYAPFRKSAVEELCRRTGATPKAATELINRGFDARQQEIYAADPMAANRDLNRIVVERKRQEEIAAKERAEQLERSRQNALLYQLEKQERREREERRERFENRFRK